MASLLSFLAKPKNQKTLSWLGGGLVVVVGGIWAIVTYVWPRGEAGQDHANIVCAQQGSIAAGHDVSGNAIKYNGSAPVGSGGHEASCAEPAKRQ
jgi:hypothetical protein